MFILAHLSDVHLAPLPLPSPSEMLSKRGLGYLNWLRKRRRIHRPEVLQALIVDLLARKADHIAVTGDLVNFSLTTEFAPARALLERIGPPDHVTLGPGNHDSYVRAARVLPGQHWGDYMRGDAGDSFPFVRRRGPLALIGLSTSLPTLPLAATGRLHGDQLARLDRILAKLQEEKLFRVILIHHPPVPNANRFRRMTDAAEFREVLRKRGAELVLHGHHHAAELVWLAGPWAAVPCIGVPSASGAEGHHDDPAGYNLYEIDGEPGAFRCTMIERGLRGGEFAETGRRDLTS
jgi:3',5'-cyclic AMP phosphodiesterase CpdA